jgi:hypothetical protein
MANKTDAEIVKIIEQVIELLKRREQERIKFSKSALKIEFKLYESRIYNGKPYTNSGLNR